MLGPDSFLLLADGLLAYGPTPGVELIPYFLGLLAWAGVAFASILLSPISALLRRLRRARGTPQAEPKTAPVPGSAGEGSNDKPEVHIAD